MPTPRGHSLNKNSNQSLVGQQADSSRLYLIVNIRSGWKDQVESRYGIPDSPGSLEHLPSLPLFQVICLIPLNQWTEIPMSPIRIFHKPKEVKWHRPSTQQISSSPSHQKSPGHCSGYSHTISQARRKSFLLKGHYPHVMGSGKNMKNQKYNTHPHKEVPNYDPVGRQK